MTFQQEIAKRFEDYLLEHITQMGMTAIRNPELKNGSTPDFLVEHEGRSCYVEATHIEGPDEFREKRGEKELRELLDENAPSGWIMNLRYPHDEGGRLNDPISKRDRGIKQIVDWLSGMKPNPEGEEKYLELMVKGIRVSILVEPDPTAEKNRVGWSKGSIQGGPVRKRHEKLRGELKGKYDKYTAGSQSLGEIPLVIATFNQTINKQEMSEALYGTRLSYITLSGDTGRPLTAGTETMIDGVWLNNRSGEQEYRNKHLAGVWHFRAMEDPKRPALLFTNPYGQDINSVIPKPILEDKATEGE